MIPTAGLQVVRVCSKPVIIGVERLPPLFVLVNSGREIGRIRGYPGEDNFWGLLGVLIKKLNEPGTGGERA